MHHDKFLVGEGSTFVPYKCTGFLYSKLNVPIYRIPKVIEVSVLAQNDPSRTPLMGYYELEKASAPDDDGFILYIYNGPLYFEPK